MAGKLFVVSAASGAGKTSLVQAALADLSTEYNLERVVTYTSKSPRPGEQAGVDYHFLSVQEFETKIQEGFFVEWSNAYGNYYGSPYSMLNVVAQGDSRIIILDRAGARAVGRLVPEAILIWIYTSDIDMLRQRLIGRGQDTPYQIQYRFSLAQEEIEQERQDRLFHHHVLNDDFHVAAEYFKNIIRTECALAKQGELPGTEPVYRGTLADKC